MSEKKKIPVAVLISGSGTNLQALIDATQSPDYPARIVLTLSSNPQAYGLERARAAGIITKALPHKAYGSRTEFDAALHKELLLHGVELVCLAGFMRILTDDFIAHWHNRMLNIHPSLLPAYRGLNTHARVLANGDREHGCTVHLVRRELDTGPVILQAKVPVYRDDLVDDLRSRVLEKEHIIYPQALRMLCDGTFKPADGPCEMQNL